MGAPALRTSTRTEPESGLFARDEPRAGPPPRLVIPAAATAVRDEEWGRLCVGVLAMAAFVAAGFVHLWRGLPVAVYLAAVTIALAAFAIGLFVPDTRFSRAPSGKLARELSVRRLSRPLKSKVGTEVVQ